MAYESLHSLYKDISNDLLTTPAVLDRISEIMATIAPPCIECVHYSAMMLAGTAGWCYVKGNRPDGPSKSWFCFKRRSP